MPGSVKKVTDQANKLGRSITNLLGQLVRVNEPDPDPNRSSDPLGAESVQISRQPMVMTR